MDPLDPLSPAQAPRELELKLFVPPGMVDRVWAHPLVVAHAIGPMKVARLHNRYFDTADNQLAAHGMALRLRRSGRRWVQTLKTRGSDDGALSARGEWEMPVGGPSLEVGKLADTPLATLGAPRALARRLAPVFSTDFRRESRMLRLADGGLVELAFDRGTIAMGRGRARRTTPICEVEIELKQAGGKDAARQLLRFAAALNRDLVLIPLAASKAARGYRLGDAEVVAATRVDLPAPNASDRARPFLARILSACNDALLANAHALFATDPRIDHADGSVEYVHQARVAIRRMRSAFVTFHPVARSARFAALDEALRTIGHAFGNVRDRDVLAASTMKRIVNALDEDHVDDGAGDVGDAIAALRTTLADQREAGHRMLIHALQSGVFGATTLAIQRLAARLAADDEAGPALDHCAPRWLAKQFERVIARGRRIAVLDLEARHGLRIEVKRLRYALDLFGGLFDAAAVARFNDALADLQTRLGKLNDEAVAEQWLRALDASAARDLVLARYSAWFAHHLAKQLPKVGAQSVALELARRPWAGAPHALT